MSHREREIVPDDRKGALSLEPFTSVWNTEDVSVSREAESAWWGGQFKEVRTCSQVFEEYQPMGNCSTIKRDSTRYKGCLFVQVTSCYFRKFLSFKHFLSLSVDIQCIHQPVCLCILDLTAELHRRIWAMEIKCYCKILHISYKDHFTIEEVRAKNPAGNRTTWRSPDDRKETQTAVVWSCFPFIRSGQSHPARQSERGKKTRRTKEEVGRRH